ncbi:MAG: hypothetical protein LBG08_08480 [Spirochaetaceae bacterium]|nr:hypothetical protein [Spirochaetaceae bacterium]
MERPARGIVSLILTALLACGVAGAAGMVISCGSPEGGPASTGDTDDSGGNGGGGWGGGTAATPVITSQPQDAVYTLDATANPLSVTASVTGGGSLSYRWYSNNSNSNSGGTEIPGATAADYTPPTDTEGTVYYYVEVTNAIDVDSECKSRMIADYTPNQASQFRIFLRSPRGGEPATVRRLFKEISTSASKNCTPLELSESYSRGTGCRVPAVRKLGVSGSVGAQGR